MDNFADKLVEIRPGRHLNIVLINDDPSGDRPTLFLFHGAGGRGDQWREQIKVLSKNYRLVIPDWLGHGHSEKPRDPANYSFAEMLDDAQAVFDKYAGPHNSLIGHSYGGALAICVTERNPDRVEKLVLLAPLAVHPVPIIPPVYTLPVFVLELMRHHLEKRFADLAFDHTASPMLINEEKMASRVNPMYMIKPLFSGIKYLPRLDTSHIATSTLILAGETDHIIPVNIIKTFYGFLPHHELIILPQTGHMLMLENSLEVNSLIENFLSAHY